jgi:signal transduction histidine kinase/CheY-like chemotaxis protein
MFHEAADALLVVDPISERVLDANVMAERLSEFGRDELVRLSLRTLVRHEQEWQDWLVPGGPSTPLPDSDHFLLRTRQPDRWVPVSVAFSRVQPAGGDPVALCRLRDRREQVEIQRRLQRAEGDVRRLLGRTSEGLYSARVEPDGRLRYRYLAPVLQRLTGRPLAVLLQDPRAREQAVHPDDLPRWHDFLARVRAGQGGEVEYRLRRPDGALVWVREAALVTPDDGGGLLVHGAVTDISDRKRAQEPAAPDHAARLEGLAHLAGVISHDLNNLITALLGNVSLLRLGTTADHLAAASLGQLEAVGQRAGELSRQLATVAGRGPAPEGATDLEALLRALAGPLQASLSPGQRLCLNLADDLPPVAADHASLAVVVEQLTSNARHALGGGPGEIELRTAAAHDQLATPGELRYPAQRPDGPLVCLEVRDTGPGLSAEAQARLFEPFFSTHGGRGLGLATVLGIVRTLQGAVEVANSDGRGATFRVLLPAATLPAPSRAVAPALVPARQVSGTVLLCDDEGPVLEVVSRLLTSLGCKVLSARSGEEVLECYRRHTDEVCLVLVDLVMPRLSGEQVLVQLRQQSPELPVLVMSGHAEQEVVARLRPLGLTGYLQKPFRLPVLLEAIRPYLAGG